MTDDLGYGPNAEFWIKIMREGLDRYRTELTDPAVLASLGPLDGRHILDAGCGEGYLSRILASRGAKVTGIDLNPALIRAAVDLETSDPQGITYLNASITEPLEVNHGAFDACVANHVLNDIEHLDTALSQLHHALKPGGRLVALVLHPCFYWQRSGLPEDDLTWIDQYFQQRPRLQRFNVADIQSPTAVQAWYRPLEAYAAALTTTGYTITSLAEPHPSADQLNDPWWATNWSRPTFLLITATTL